MTVVYDGFTNPIDVAIDETAGKLYVSDADGVHRMDLDASDLETVLRVPPRVIRFKEGFKRQFRASSSPPPPDTHAEREIFERASPQASCRSRERREVARARVTFVEMITTGVPATPTSSRFTAWTSTRTTASCTSSPTRGAGQRDGSVDSSISGRFRSDYLDVSYRVLKSHGPCAQFLSSRSSSFHLGCTPRR